MNAPVNASLLKPSVAAEELAKCRAILANGTGKSPVEAAMTEWWGRLRRHQRRALLELAGVNHPSVEAQWSDLPLTHRAALAMALPDLAAMLNQIRTTISGVREQAKSVLEKEARKAMRPRVKAA